MSSPGATVRAAPPPRPRSRRCPWRRWAAASVAQLWLTEVRKPSAGPFAEKPRSCASFRSAGVFRVMKLPLRHTVLMFSLLSVTTVPTVQAAQPPKNVKELKSVEYAIEDHGDDAYTIRMVDEEYGEIGDRNSGFLRYHLATWKKKKIVHIDMVRGVKGTRGVGKMLKEELLRRYPERFIRSELIEVNEKKLLKAWAKGYPHSSNDKDGKKLRDVIPALSFEGFDYVITPKVQRIGGSIELEMKPARRGAKGSIRIEDPEALDTILVNTAPELIRASDRPKSEDELHRENEAAARKAFDQLEKFAKDTARKEKIDDYDLEEHLRDLLDASCGRGGSTGKDWADKCLFTAKGRTYVVKLKKNGATFQLEDWMEDTAEDYIKGLD